MGHLCCAALSKSYFPEPKGNPEPWGWPERGYRGPGDGLTATFRFASEPPSMGTECPASGNGAGISDLQQSSGLWAQDTGKVPEEWAAPAPGRWPAVGNTEPPESITSASSHVTAGGRDASSTQGLADPTTGPQLLDFTPGQEAPRTTVAAEPSPQAFCTKAHLISPAKPPTCQRRRLRANSE